MADTARPVIMPSSLRPLVPKFVCCKVDDSRCLDDGLEVCMHCFLKGTMSLCDL